MKKLFRHITKVLLFSFVMCLFLPLTVVRADTVQSTFLGETGVYGNYYNFQQRFFGVNYDSSTSPVILYYDDVSQSDAKTNRYYFAALVNTRLGLTVKQKSFVSTKPYGDEFEDSKQDLTHEPSHVENAIGNYCYYTPIGSSTVGSKDHPWKFDVPVIPCASLDQVKEYIVKGDLTDDIPVDTDNYSLDKSLGHVTNAKWKHLVSNDLKSKVVSDGFAQYGVGVDGTAKMDSYTYSRYSAFSKDKCSFATKSSTGLNLLDSRYQLQYCSRVQMTFHYNLLDVIPTDNTKDYTKRFTSPKPYPAVNGCSFDAAKNIESLFSQGFTYNESLPAFGTALRNFLFDETKYWIDVRIVDKKTHKYGAWYAMALEDNKARVITTDDGDIGSDVDSEEDVGNYTKIEGTGDTFDDAEDNSHEVKDTEQFSKDKWSEASKGVKDSYSTAKSLIKMVAGLPQMIGTLFSWLPSWCLSLVAVFFSIIIVLALLRFILGS